MKIVTPTYKECKITKHKDGTFSVEKNGYLHTEVSIIRRRGFKTLEEAQQAIDEAEEKANGILATCKELAGKINTTYTEVEALNTAAEESGRKALQKAISIGEMLIKVKKQLAYGYLDVWRAENCKDICEKTSQNYMRLASPEPQYSAALKECTSIRQAYMVIGVIKPAKAKAIANGSATSSKSSTSTATGSTSATPAAPAQGTTTGSNSGFTSPAGNGVTVSIGTENEPLANQPLEDLVEAIMFQLDGLDSDKSKSVAYETLQPIKEWLETEVFAEKV
jgi:hypothetical protein